MKIVTSYIEPDLDGTSCMYAYSELLNRLGENASYHIWNEPKQETQIVCDMFGIKLGGEKEFKDGDKYIIVDLNNYGQVDPNIKREDIIEIIDHHGISRELHLYTSCERIQIDKIGAAATIVTERYKESGLIPSREAAILLYYGIISNSINLKANITSARDKAATDWLKSVCRDISEEKIKDIFMKKSNIADENLRLEMECEIPMTAHNKQVLVGQLEMCDIENFINNKKDLINKILTDIDSEKDLDFLFVNMVDILNGYSLIYTLDEESKKMMNRLFDLEFEGPMARFDGLVQRKEITKAIRDFDGELEF